MKEVLLWGEIIGLCPVIPLPQNGKTGNWSAAADYVRMIFLDTITANPDRHTANFGLLRDIKTGALIGLAPLFDHNMALISRGDPKIPTNNDFLIRIFNEFVSYHPDVKKYLPKITRNNITLSLNKTDVPVNREYIMELERKLLG